MRKYWAVFRTMWQTQVEYRVDFFAHLVVGLITLVVLIFIWSAVFKQTPTFGNYTLSSMITYLAMVRILHFASRGNLSRIIGDNIRNGNISIDILRPINYLKWCFSYFLSDRLFEMLVRFSLFFIFLLVLPDIFKLASSTNFVAFVLFLPVSLFLNFLFNLLIAYFAFHVTDIRLFSNTIGMTMAFFGGDLIPVDLLPGALKSIGLFLPFQFTIYFPVKLYQGALNSYQIVSGCLLALFWIVFLTAIVSYLWKRGLRRYEAVGI